MSGHGSCAFGNSSEPEIGIVTPESNIRVADVYHLGVAKWCEDGFVEGSHGGHFCAGDHKVEVVDSHFGTSR